MKKLQYFNRFGILLIALTAMTVVMVTTSCVPVTTPTYMVSYDGNGNTSGSAPVDPKGYKSGESATILGVGDLGKTGNNFVGWTENTAGTGTVYVEGQKLSVVGDITLYAKWSVVSTPSASLYAQEGTLTAPATFPIKADISLAGKTVQTAKIYTTGDVFIGDLAFVSGILWQYNAINVPAGNYALKVVVVFTDSTTITSNSELFVVNAAGTYTVTYHNNNATSGTPPTDAGSYTNGSNVTVKDASSLARTYHGFKNWNTKADGTGDSYGIGATLIMGSANVDLYPAWEKIAVTSVTLDTHTLSLKIGESATLTVTVSPPTADPDVSWSASSTDAMVTKLNATQARVDAVGVVTGATVDVASSWSPSFNDVCTVNVTYTGKVADGAGTAKTGFDSTTIQNAKHIKITGLTPATTMAFMPDGSAKDGAGTAKTGFDSTTIQNAERIEITGLTPATTMAFMPDGSAKDGAGTAKTGFDSTTIQNAKHIKITGLTPATTMAFMPDGSVKDGAGTAKTGFDSTTIQNAERIEITGLTPATTMAFMPDGSAKDGAGTAKTGFDSTTIQNAKDIGITGLTPITTLVFM